jgi:hypothetical protein
MSPAMQSALKKALVAAVAAGLTVFFREFTKEQERLDRELAGK